MIGYPTPLMANRYYLVDSDVLITAKNLYYAFDICPGFWKSLLHHHREGQVFSVERVRYRVEEHRLQKMIGRWFFASTLTERYVYSPESAMSGYLVRSRPSTECSVR